MPAVKLTLKYVLFSVCTLGALWSLYREVRHSGELFNVAFFSAGAFLLFHWQPK
jgi:hypothetical protein